ncbi:TPA: Fe-S-containing hydro-lyase [Candidatus Poribacteria bacterium]|nr:Fe-S-containing hydro-lyase [Candidatus Poribacteria bacterium]
MGYHELSTPLGDEDVAKLRSGDRVRLSGVIYTARDAAHRRMVEAIRAGEPLPFDPRGAVIYYVGPAPARPGSVIGPAGPTTSSRMDPYTIPLLELGLKGMIGKGGRCEEVKRAMRRFKAVYMAAVGGAAALMTKHIISCRIIAYHDLGTEAVRELIVRDMPLFVVNDIYGGDLYEKGRERWRR